MPSTVTCQGHPAAVQRLAVDMQEILSSIAHSPKMCSGSRMDLIESEHVLKMPTTMICTEPCFAGPFGDLASRLLRRRHHMLSQAKSQYFKGAVIGVWTQQWHSNCLTSPFGVWFLAHYGLLTISFTRLREIGVRACAEDVWLIGSWDQHSSKKKRGLGIYATTAPWRCFEWRADEIEKLLGQEHACSFQYSG